MSPIVRALVLVLVVAAPVAAAGACAAERFLNNRVYAACTDLPTLDASLHWTYNPAASSLSVAFVATPSSPGGWVSWGLNPTGDGMVGLQALIAAPQSGGGYAVQTYDFTGYTLVSPGPIAYPASDLATELGADGRVQMFGKLALQNGTGEVNHVWQVGPVSGGILGAHALAAANNDAKGKLNLVTGVTTAASGGGSILREKNIHGVLCAVSWGILLPIGAIVARYLKTFKSADPAWYYLHVGCQVIGYAVGVSGWATGLHLGNFSTGITYSLHRNIGIAVFVIGNLQVLSMFVRPKKDHKFRVHWNAFHISAGYTIIIMGIINIFEGMVILNVEKKWKTGYIIVIGILGGIAVALEAITWSIVLKRRKTKDKAGAPSDLVHPYDI